MGPTKPYGRENPVRACLSTGFLPCSSSAFFCTGEGPPAGGPNGPAEAGPKHCPPFRLSYQGLGEPLCFAAFGPFATTAFYFSQSSKDLSSGMNLLPLSATVLCASVLVGLTTTFILFCSHFHQIDGDTAVGKMSPLVRIGTERGSKLIKIGIFVLYFLLFTFSACKSLPLSCAFLCAITIPIAKLVVDFVEQNHNNKIKIFMAKYYCVRLHSLFGAALTVGLVVARGGLQLMS